MGLVLKRQRGQLVHIGEDITIEIVETHTGSTSLEITAPESVAIRRGELPMQEAPRPKESDTLATA